MNRHLRGLPGPHDRRPARPAPPPGLSDATTLLNDALIAAMLARHPDPAEQEQILASLAWDERGVVHSEVYRQWASERENEPELSSDVPPALADPPPPLPPAALAEMAAVDALFDHVPHGPRRLELLRSMYRDADGQLHSRRMLLRPVPDPPGTPSSS